MKGKFKETSLATLALIIVVSLCFVFNIAQFNLSLYLRFLLACALSIAGQMIFLLGAETSLVPVGRHTGTSLMKKKKTWIILLFGFLLGLFATIAEPDVQVLAELATGAEKYLDKIIFIGVLGIGVALFSLLAYFRILKNIDHKIVFIGIFIIITILAIFSSEQNLMLAFDASGTTTGIITVPFIMALTIGLSQMRGIGTKEDNFGVVGIATTGTIISFLIFSLFSKNNFVTLSVSQNNFWNLLFSTAIEIMISLAPLLIFFFIMQLATFKFPKQYFKKIIKGFLLSFVGLTLFVTSVIFGFAPIGEYIALSVNSKVVIAILLVVLGFVLVFTEPAIKILLEQIKEGTNNFISRKYVFISLSIAVSLSFLLNFLKINFGFHYGYIIFPLIAIALILMFFSPSIFTLIAFDSGGIVAGTILTSFILPFFIGISINLTGSSQGALGMIATVTITPLIAIETLGVIYNIKTKRLKKQQEKQLKKQLEQENPSANLITTTIIKENTTVEQTEITEQEPIAKQTPITEQNSTTEEKPITEKKPITDK